LGDGWLTIIPLLAIFAAAIWLGARATGVLAVAADTRLALWALGLWALLALVLSRLLGERIFFGGDPDAINRGGLPIAVVVLALLLAGAALVLARRAERLSADRGQGENQERPAPLAVDA
jgi:hypothetical protein